jgi:hypothetical protein
MVNRVIQQKIIKQKRMRRAWAKRFSMRNAGPMRYPGFFNDQGEFVDMSLRSRTQSARVNDLDSQLNDFLRRKFRFKLSDPESIYARHRGLHTDMTHDGELVLARMVQSRSGAGTLQGEQKFVRSVCIKRDTCLRTLYMSGETNFFIEVRVTEGGTVFLRSCEYIDRQMALLAHKTDNILWEEISNSPEADTNSSSDAQG